MKSLRTNLPLESKRVSNAQMLSRNIYSGFLSEFNRLDVPEHNETPLSLIVVTVIELPLEFAVCKPFAMGCERTFLILLIRPNRKPENSTWEVGCVCKLSSHIISEYLNYTPQCLQKAQDDLCTYSISFDEEGFSTQLCVVGDWNPKEDIA